MVLLLRVLLGAGDSTLSAQAKVLVNHELADAGVGGGEKAEENDNSCNAKLELTLKQLSG